MPSKPSFLNISGIYKIINLANGKIYIGSAINIRKRRSDHFRNLQFNRHCNQYLQKSYNKYGKENFYFEVIEECDKQYCIEREQFYMDLYNPEYNICRKAGSILGIKRSKETCEKLSKSNTGKKHSIETKLKQSKIRIGKYLGANSPSAIKIIQYDLNMNFIKEYEAITTASKETNILRTAIGNCLNNRSKIAGGFIWKYKIEENGRK